jgi:predicted cupin superfamily sugar epimerase
MNETLLGDDLENNEVPQLIIPSGTIFGASVNQPNSFTLIGCMVSPGFDFEDFELMDRKYLLKKYTQHKAIILKLTGS